MNERDQFLRDRLQPDQPGVPAMRPPGPPPAGPRPVAPAAPAVAAPHVSRPAPPRPPAPAQQPPRPGAPPGPDPQSPRQAPAPVPPHPEAPSRPQTPPAVQLPDLPDRGWRRFVRLATFGLINPGPSAAQRQDAQYEAAIRAALHGTYKVGVLGKGGVGKTSVAASVGSLLAELRRHDHVVAIDADTAFGRLSSRIDPRSSGSFWELTSDKNLRSFADVVGRLGRNPAGLHVLGGEPAAGPRRVLDPAIYREAARQLDRHFTISVIDCGSTMDSPVTQEVLRDLDALLVVTSPWADGANAAARTIEWLSERGQTGLLRRTIVVLNDSDGHADKRTRELLAREFVDHGQPVIEVPYDPHLRPGGVIDVNGEMAPATRRKFLQITATIAGHFAARPDSRQGR
ncbi:MinD/ParA family protein [Mycobacterium sp.]|uniref:MinD/ParA family ATP-binding protein n=1 Tax=Mycobacterium sp. TaxID=1785 RepID=UPI002B95C791|nr:MinD/ParA family protein [Mycobacterium sp.]HTY33527.1 MinD/ParA family protein [Mycobacterium sp.]